MKTDAVRGFGAVDFFFRALEPLMESDFSPSSATLVATAVSAVGLRDSGVGSGDSATGSSSVTYGP